MLMLASIILGVCGSREPVEENRFGHQYRPIRMRIEMTGMISAGTFEIATKRLPMSCLNLPKEGQSCRFSTNMSRNILNSKMTIKTCSTRDCWKGYR